MMLTRDKKTSPDPSVVLTNRTAIDSSGSIGSLYDGYRDCIMGNLNVKNTATLYQPMNEVQCNIIDPYKNQNHHLLQHISIDEQLRLSVLLELTPKKNIAEIIDYSFPTKDYIRLFCYSYIHQIQQLPLKVEDAHEFIKPPTTPIKATHIITSVYWGIEFIVVLQLPSAKETVDAIDTVLRRIPTLLKNDQEISTLNLGEEKLLESIVHTQIYSNTSDLYRVHTLRDVCKYIEKNKRSTVHPPVSYTLRSIEWLTPYSAANSTRFTPLPTSLINNIEEYLLQLRNDIKQLEIDKDVTIPRLLYGHLKDQQSRLARQWSAIDNKYKSEIQRLSKLVTDVRSGRILMSTFEQEFKSDGHASIKKTIRELTQSFEDLKQKGKLIDSLTEQKFHYYDVVDYGIDRTDNAESIEHKLVSNEQDCRVLCSNDALNEAESKQLRGLRRKMVEEWAENTELRLIYADFSYCSYELQNITTLPSNMQNDMENRKSPKSVKTRPSHPLPKEAQITTSTPTKEVRFSDALTRNIEPSVWPLDEPQIIRPVIKQGSTSDSTTKIKTHSHPSSFGSELSPNKDDINILLLGETGVGKSTFINAFANYLTFDTLQQAERNQPVVLIPVSFLITVGDNFDEYIVRFGDVNDSKNEDFEHSGQSVTQHCKSHVFYLDPNHQQKLCIIDTPGFGDTRGIDQDDYNMAHILEYIKNLSHLNAVCFLLKPNESRLNIFLRSCLIQLFTLLGPNIADQILFCFTNSRSTFYTPGNTAPLLKKMLKSLAQSEVPFKKDNTFCFDSESFRYLVALRNKIPFSIQDKQEYEMSWTKSATEANRLLGYIRTHLRTYRISHQH